jgi:hypothetical protein
MTSGVDKGGRSIVCSSTVTVNGICDKLEAGSRTFNLRTKKKVANVLTETRKCERRYLNSMQTIIFYSF